MLAALASILILSAPPAGGGCIDAWPKAAAPSKATTEGCIDVLLRTAYGPKVDEEALTLDPGYGDPIELELTTDELAAIGKHITVVCPETGGDNDWRCTRVIEYVDGMSRRKMSLFDGVEAGSFAEVLQTILKGEAVSPESIRPAGGAPWSPLALGKLRNAAYARHGYVFAKDDYNHFFYDPRPEGLGDGAEGVPANLLPLARGDKKKVELTPVDNKNIKIILDAEKAGRKAGR